MLATERAPRIAARSSTLAVRAPLLQVPLAKTRLCSALLTFYRQRSPSLHRQADRAVAELRRAGGHRDGERAADHRDARGAGQQTATAEVLQVINASPGDLAPVFDAMLEGVRLCEAAFGGMWTYDGERFQPRPLHGVAAAMPSFLPPRRRGSAGDASGSTAFASDVVHILESPMTRPIDRTPEGVRAASNLAAAGPPCMPLSQDEALLGAIAVYRQEVRPFSDKQIALLRKLRGAGGDRYRERAAVRELRARTATCRSRWNIRPRPATC